MNPDIIVRNKNKSIISANSLLINAMIARKNRANGKSINTKFMKVEIKALTEE